MRTSIVKTIINSREQEKRRKDFISAVRKTLKKYGISVRKLYEEYNIVYKKQPIPYASFYYKINNHTFSDNELDNLGFIIEQIETGLKQK